jgi:hypothetical protein
MLASILPLAQQSMIVHDVDMVRQLLERGKVRFCAVKAANLVLHFKLTIRLHRLGRNHLDPFLIGR